METKRSNGDTITGTYGRMLKRQMSGAFYDNPEPSGIIPSDHKDKDGNIRRWIGGQWYTIKIQTEDGNGNINK